MQLEGVVVLGLFKFIGEVQREDYMFLINQIKNEAHTIQKRTFSELGLKERKHLQEWIDKNTDILHENLLIIQKEFAGFDDTNERLDLLAIDEKGNLVVIENKLDDSGKDVTWQSLKYVSYCSSLTKDDIVDIYQEYLDKQGNGENAADKILSFLPYEDIYEVEINKGDQRIILIAANFRKEVTSAVMWLIEHNVKIKCIKVTPYQLNDDILVDSEQIIPVKDIEEYTIKLANKKQNDRLDQEKEQTRHITRRQFWTDLLSEMKNKTDLFSNISPTKDNWINCGIGYGGFCYTCVITSEFARIELNINKGVKEENKCIFDQILIYKSTIENDFGDELEWERLDNRKSSRVAYYLKDVNVFNRDDWPQIIAFITSKITKFDSVIRPILKELF